MNFIFETTGNKNSSAEEPLSKKHATFLRFMFKNDVKFVNQSIPLTSFVAMKRKKVAYFFDKSSCTLEFLLPIDQN